MWKMEWLFSWSKWVRMEIFYQDVKMCSLRLNWARTTYGLILLTTLYLILCVNVNSNINLFTHCLISCVQRAWYLFPLYFFFWQLGSMEAAGVEDFIMLNNGCMCCIVWAFLVRMIGELLSKKKDNLIILS